MDKRPPPRTKIEPQLWNVAALRIGDGIKTSSKAKEARVAERKPGDGVIVLTLSNGDVRTYRPDDRVILVSRERSENL